MRLPTDLLLSVLDVLPRDSLDTIAISNRLIGVLCGTNFSVYPLRMIDLTVNCREYTASVVSVAGTASPGSDAKYLHTKLESLGRYMPNATLRYLSLEGQLDERILELMLPFVDRFRTAVLMHNNPYECSRLSFASLDVFIRAYNDLFFCHTLAISPVYISGAPPDVNGANARLLTLPCPQQCLCIFFKNMPTANAGDITAWLTSGSDKKMFMDGTPHEEREAFAHELIEKVVEQFLFASTASNFSVVYEFNMLRQRSLKARVCENTATSEKLVVNIERCIVDSIRMTIHRSRL